MQTLGALFISRPWLVLLPCLVLGALYWLSQKSLARTAALAWLVYGVYEYGMLTRRLCTGECNIRIDLLLIYPALILLSIAALVSAARGPSRR